MVTFFGGVLYAGPLQNTFSVPQNGAWSQWQQLYSEYPIFAKIQCRQANGVNMTFEYTGQGAGCHICFTVTATDNYIFTPTITTNLKTGQYVTLLVMPALCYFPNLPGIAVSIDRFIPYITGFHPPMRPCKGQVPKLKK